MFVMTDKCKQKWSDKEKAFFLKNGKRLTNKDIAIALKRSVDSVKCFRYYWNKNNPRKKICSPQKWGNKVSLSDKKRILRLIGEVPISLIAKDNNLSLSELHSMVRVLKKKDPSLSTKVETDYYSVNFLSENLKIDRRRVAKWIKDGLLKASKSSQNKGSPWLVTAENWRAFCLQHPSKIKDCDRQIVDWLKGCDLLELPEIADNYSISAIAQVLNVSRSRVRAWVEAGKLKTEKELVNERHRQTVTRSDWAAFCYEQPDIVDKLEPLLVEKLCSGENLNLDT